MNDPHIEALLRERAGYVNSGKRDRLAAVDAELKRLGHKSETATRAKAEPADPDEVRLDALRQDAEKAGVKVDRRWGADKLREEIAAAKKK